MEVSPTFPVAKHSSYDKLNDAVCRAKRLSYMAKGRWPKGFDCWGLMLFLLQEGFNIVWPDVETATPDVIRGYHCLVKQMRLSNARPGDLIMFPEMPHGELHCGMILEEARFIHCTENGVSEQSLSRQPFNRMEKQILRPVPLL